MEFKLIFILIVINCTNGAFVENAATSFANKFNSNGEEEFNLGVVNPETDDPNNNFSLDSDPFFEQDLLNDCGLDLDNFECQNVSTLEPPEKRLKDIVFSKLTYQIWSDFEKVFSERSMIDNETIDPFDVDKRMPEPISFNQSTNMFMIEAMMKDLKILGLSTLKMNESSFTRNENVTDMELSIRFVFDSLELVGNYELRGQFGWLELDSQGQQSFSILLVNPFVTFNTKMGVIDDTLIAKCNLSSEEFLDKIILTKIRLTLEYSALNIKFENIGGFAGSVVNAIGDYILKTQEILLAEKIIQYARDHLNIHFCNLK